MLEFTHRENSLYLLIRVALSHKCLPAFFKDAFRFFVLLLKFIQYGCIYFQYICVVLNNYHNAYEC